MWVPVVLDLAGVLSLTAARSSSTSRLVLSVSSRPARPSRSAHLAPFPSCRGKASHPVRPVRPFCPSCLVRLVPFMQSRPSSSARLSVIFRSVSPHPSRFVRRLSFFLIGAPHTSGTTGVRICNAIARTSQTDGLRFLVLRALLRKEFLRFAYPAARSIQGY